ncbi:MAG TPA: S53 family peptidase, partial [Pseudonocardiaceae bacterium]
GGQTVALWEFDGYQASNIATYDSEFGINAPTPQTVSVDGANFDASPGQGQGEVELDIEIVQAMANAANTLVYEAPNSDQGQIDLANQIASEDRVSVTSISWGACETASSAATISSTDNALAQGAAEGISFYVASGDSGSDDCQDGSTAVDSPASDPNVSGVGGTSLSTDGAGNYQSETAWSGSGGGLSTVFGTPSYQNDPSGQRSVPDVSSNADPNTGYAIFSAGQWQVFGGTSCAAPMWAGFTALYDGNRGVRLGNGNPLFYSIGNGPSYGSAFQDITSGSNGGFNAGPGYDAVTGWGTYNGAGLAAALG